MMQHRNEHRSERGNGACVAQAGGGIEIMQELCWEAAVGAEVQQGNGEHPQLEELNHLKTIG
jgi:hypothetical protein